MMKEIKLTIEPAQTLLASVEKILRARNRRMSEAFRAGQESLQTLFWMCIFLGDYPVTN